MFLTRCMPSALTKSLSLSTNENALLRTCLKYYEELKSEALALALCLLADDHKKKNRPTYSMTEVLTTFVIIRQKLFFFAVISCLLLKLLLTFKFKIAGFTFLSLQQPECGYGAQQSCSATKFDKMLSPLAAHSEHGNSAYLSRNNIMYM